MARISSVSCRRGKEYNNYIIKIIIMIMIMITIIIVVEGVDGPHQQRQLPPSQGI